MPLGSEPSLIIPGGEHPCSTEGTRVSWSGCVGPQRLLWLFRISIGWSSDPKCVNRGEELGQERVWGLIDTGRKNPSSAVGAGGRLTRYSSQEAPDGKWSEDPRRVSQRHSLGCPAVALGHCTIRCDHRIHAWSPVCDGWVGG